MTKRNTSDGVDVAVAADHLLEEAESAVLGAVLLAGSIALPALSEEGLTPEDFSRPGYRRIFGAMCAMHEAGEPVDRLTLADRLLRDGDGVDGRVTVDALAGSVPNVGNMRQYARMVVRASMWRERVGILQAALDVANSEDEPRYRAMLGVLRKCELRFRPLLERDLQTP